MRDASCAVIVLLLLGSWHLVPSRAEASDPLLLKAVRGTTDDGYWKPGKVPRTSQYYRGKSKRHLIAGTMIVTRAGILGITAMASLLHYHNLEAPDGYYDDNDPGMFGYGSEWHMLSAVLAPFVISSLVSGIPFLISGAVYLHKARKLEALSEGRYPMPVLAMSPDGSGGTLGFFFRF